MNVLLVGLRGTGKSTVARLVAERLGWPWHDVDVEVERRAGQSIAEIFAERGELSFRELEATLLAELCAGDRQVLALGGGSVLRAENRDAMRRAGKTVWLSAPPETLWERIQRDATTAARRPNLTQQGGIAEIRQLLVEREPLYRQCADVRVETQDKSPAEVADYIVQELAISPA
jgi:shikimate kinase